MTTIERILVPVDFSPSSDAALEHALTVADECGAEVELLYVWRPRDPAGETAIFADTPEGLALEQRLTTAEGAHSARVCGRLEFGGDPSSVILDILERERFDLVVMGLEGDGKGGGRNDEAGGHVTANVAKTTRCKVVTIPPPPPAETAAA